MMKKLLILLFAFNLTALTLQTQTTTWTNGNGNQEWNDAGNWSDGVPDATTDVTLDSSPGPIISANDAQTKILILIGEGVTLEIQSGGVLTCNGISEVLSSGTLNVNGGNVTFQNSFSLQNSGNLIIQTNGNVDIAGNLTVLSGSSATLNQGFLNIYGDMDVSGAGSSFNNNTGSQVNVGSAPTN